MRLRASIRIYHDDAADWRDVAPDRVLHIGYVFKRDNLKAAPEIAKLLGEEIATSLIREINDVI